MHVAAEDLVFTDRSEDLSAALELLFAKNKSITDMELLNLRFGDRLIDSIGRGLRSNTTLKVLNMQGNSIASC